MPTVHRSLATCLSLVALTIISLPSRVSADIATIRHSIESSDILPKDYREHINIVESRNTVSLSVYRDPDAKPNDCRIDAILLTHKILTSGSAPKQVRVVFYDLLEADKYWQVDVNPASVWAYARGAIGKNEVIRSARLSIHQANTLAKTYARVPYKQIIDGLGVVDGPLQDQRAVALIRIDNLQGKGQDVTDLRRQYLHLEDLVRRGEQEPLKQSLADLSGSIDKIATASVRESMLDALGNTQTEPVAEDLYQMPSTEK